MDCDSLMLVVMDWIPNSDHFSQIFCSPHEHISMTHVHFIHGNWVPVLCLTKCVGNLIFYRFSVIGHNSRRVLLFSNCFEAICKACQKEMVCQVVKICFLVPVVLPISD